MAVEVGECTLPAILEPSTFDAGKWGSKGLSLHANLHKDDLNLGTTNIVNSEKVGVYASEVPLRKGCRPQAVKGQPRPELSLKLTNPLLASDN